LGGGICNLFVPRFAATENGSEQLREIMSAETAMERVLTQNGRLLKIGGAIGVGGAVSGTVV
jgi:hypothetical protein